MGQGSTMRTTTVSLLLSAFLVTTGCSSGDDPKDKPKPKFTIGKGTTYVTAPVDKDGYIDYEAALNERLGKGIKPEENANVLLWKALGPRPEGGEMPAEYFKLLGIDPPPERGEYFVDLPRFSKERLKLEPGEATDAINEQLRRASRRAWSAHEYPAVAAWLEVNKKPFALVIEATKRPRYFNPLVAKKSEKGTPGLMSVIPPTWQKSRELADALTARAMLSLGAQRLEDAWQDLLACHRLARLTAQGGSSVDALVGMAIELSSSDLTFVAHPKLTSAQVQSCLGDLQKLPPMPPIADKIDLAERFMYLEIVMLINRHGLEELEKLSSVGGKPANPLLKEIAKDINWDPALRLGNRRYDRLAAAMRAKDRSEREKQLDQIESDLKKRKGEILESDFDRVLIGTPEEKGQVVGDILWTLLSPALRNFQRAADRAEQVQHNLHVAFALAAYQRDQGRYPAKLDELAPKYLPQVPGDIFSGKALNYKQVENGYLLYSVGPNGQDNGGRPREDGPDNDDLVVRMPLPEVKR